MTDAVTRHRKLTQDELVAEARRRFGDDPMEWAFTCPHCGVASTGRDVGEALRKHPRRTRDGERVIASDVLGQECIGRIDPNRGCDWAAFGLFRGPWEIEMPDGHSAWSFPLAGGEPGA